MLQLILFDGYRQRFFLIHSAQCNVDNLRGTDNTQSKFQLFLYVKTSFNRVFRASAPVTLVA
jgi:hypothetical protein